ncbi:hypothetical protein [Klebsiella quasipneumoniae]|uniref:hypothetical protein n=1 Tax=Klebsiella quasipneumoniae TaxID=1463165 RepID=UPI00388E75FE
MLQVNGSANIDGLSITVLDEAAELARQHYSDGSAYSCGREIERLAKFVVENQLVPNAIQDWVNQFSVLVIRIKQAESEEK